MKSFAARFILFYSAILAVFIVVSGALSARNIEEILFQLAFLPVALYLFFTTVKEIKRILNKQGPSSDVSISGKKTEFIAGIIIFIALLVFGVKNLSTNSSAQNNVTKPTKKAVESEESTPIIFEEKGAEEKNLIVKITDGSSAVNIRSGPGSFYDIVGEAQDEESFPYFEEAQGWYKIKFEEKEAWIYEKYVEVKEQELQNE